MTFWENYKKGLKDFRDNAIPDFLVVFTYIAGLVTLIISIVFALKWLI